MTDAEAAELLKAGDCLSDMLGQAVAAMEGDDPFTYTEMQLARTAILGWHRMRSIVAAGGARGSE